MAETATTKTPPKFDRIETDSAVPQHNRNSKFRQNPDEWPAVVIHFENGAKIKYLGTAPETAIVREWYHPRSPDETTVLAEIGGAHKINGGIYELAIRFVERYREFSSIEELEARYKETEVGALVDREFPTALDLFD